MGLMEVKGDAVRERLHGSPIEGCCPSRAGKIRHGRDTGAVRAVRRKR